MIFTIEMDKIYVLRHRNILRGPYSLQMLRQKGLKGHDLIWYKGLQDWISPMEIDTLAQIVKETKESKSNTSFFKRLFG